MARKGKKNAIVAADVDTAKASVQPSLMANVKTVDPVLAQLFASSVSWESLR